MTREQAKQKLISFGNAEPTEERITDFLNTIGSETKKEKDRADGYKAKADKADELQSQLDELNTQNLSEIEKATKALEQANQKIADLERKDAIRGQRSNAMEKFKITAEQASQIIKDDGSFDYDVLGQIISDKETAAASAEAKKLLNNTPNPNGNNGDGDALSKGAEMAQKYNKNNVITV